MFLRGLSEHFIILSRYSTLTLISSISFLRFFEISRNFSSLSNPKNLRFRRLAAIPVVLDPVNGSKIQSFSATGFFLHQIYFYRIQLKDSIKSKFALPAIPMPAYIVFLNHHNLKILLVFLFLNLQRNCMRFFCQILNGVFHLRQ